MFTLIGVFLLAIVILAILALINRPAGSQVVFLAVAVLLIALVLFLGHFGGKLGLLLISLVTDR